MVAGPVLLLIAAGPAIGWAQTTGTASPPSGSVNIAYRENEFTGIGSTPTAITADGSSTRTDKVFTGTVGLTYQLLRWLGASLDVSHSLTNSSDVDGDIVENRVQLAPNIAC